MYDVSEYDKDTLEKEFTMIPFTNKEDRTKHIKTIYNSVTQPEEKKPEELSEDKTDKVDEKKDPVKRKYTKKEKIIFPEKGIEKVIEKVEDTKTDLLTIFTAEDEFIISESEKKDGKKDEINEKSKKSIEENVVIADRLRAEYKEFMVTNKKFDYPNFLVHMKSKGITTLPSKLSSLNMIFGKTPYIFKADYTLALLADDKDAVRNIEKKERDNRDEKSKTPESEKSQEEFVQYF
jgi:hypothetical protein